MVLRTTGLLGFFDGRVYSACDAGRSKPAPDVYLHAAASLDVAPAEGVAIEDSVVGVQAAVSAGLAVIGFAGPEREKGLLAAGATMTCQTMAQIGELLAARRSRRSPNAARRRA